MELREFAEQVLFGTSLEEKLRPPADITDERPGSVLATPEAPGRPKGLHFKPHGSGKSEFPGLHQLENATERGRLLHFFGNHELLATELMALVLLRFPDAPPAFRKGLLQTLKDEQIHTRWYIERMKACGLEFGELPVSGYFWRCVSPMENPMDYVASLCLTFEQANLDFAGHFARGFATVGDTATAQLLGQIYKDEIGHVAYGLKWFRRWKNPTESDWDAFCRTLKFPLSPQRAKGFSLNMEGRRAAGLDPQFIAQLNVYSQSKGRTPNIYVFNPLAEGRIAGGRAFNPTRHQAQLVTDLENLPQFLGRQDDIVLVKQRPSVEFLSRMKHAGFALPEFVEYDNAVEPGTGITALRERKLGSLRPWAWGPDSYELLEPLFGRVTGETRAPEQRFNPGLAELFSKAWSAAFLRKVLQRASRSGPAAALLCGEAEAGVGVGSLTEALAAIASIRARGHHKIVVKEALGVAGSNAMRLFEPEVLEAHRRWLANTLEHGRQLVVEPWLERELDFSAQLEMTADGLRLCGYTGLLNDARGQFQGNWAEAHHHKRIPARIIARFNEPADVSGAILSLYAEIFEALETELRQRSFVGALGVDAFIYKDAAGKIRLKPVVEINPRFTMGRVTVELMNQTCQGSCGLFRLVNQAQLRAEGVADFPAYAAMLEQRHPLRLAGDAAPKIREGAICLTDPARAQVCLAVFQVARAGAPLL
jgi:uncharacterized ferritin-like protein (DUF455 family)